MQRDHSVQFESLADQFIQDCRAGNPADIEQYALDHPELAEKIRRLFPVMQLMEMESDEPIDHDEEVLREELNQLTGLPPQRELGEYQIVREIGRGGMGVVYQARQESLGRYVALKLLPEFAGFDERRYKRFQQEARASGMLVHTNIVPVFGIGRSDDISYFVMQYIDGTSLDKVIQELKAVRDSEAGMAKSLNDTAKPIDTSISGAAWRLLSPDGKTAESVSEIPKPKSNSSASVLSNASRSQATAFSSRNQYFRNVAKIGIQVSDALQYAHCHKILHRDIKPANLLLESDGHAWVTDFGLAKLMDDANLTRTGETVGTLRYLPPEQFDGKSDARSDVYSLGLTLYELLTLTPAFDGADFAQLLQNVTESDPVSPRKIEPRIPRDLATIVMKALARSPEQRYQTAGELHDDLCLFLDGKPIQAKQASEMDRLIKAMKRRPVVSTLVVLLLTALIVGSALVTWKWQEASAALTIAKQESETRQDINDFLFLDLLNYAQPESEPDPEITLRTVFDRAADRIEERFGNRPLVEAEIRLRIGTIYLGLSKPEASKVNFERALSLRVENLGPEDVLTDEAFFHLALADHDLGDYRQSLAMLNESLGFRARRFGERSVEAMRVKLELAKVMNSLGRFQDAKAEIEDYIQFAEKSNSVPETLGESHLRQAQIMVELGEYDQADDVLEGLIPKLERDWQAEDGKFALSGEMMRDFYLFLSARNTSASILEHRGYPLPAVEIHRNNFETATRLLGSGHATTLDYVANLARALAAADQSLEAKTLLEHHIPISEKSRGPHHPRTLALKNAMAILLFTDGERARAEKIMTEVRNIVRDNYGQDHPNTVTYNYNIAAVYYRTGQFEEARELLEDVVVRSRKILGVEHPQTIVALADLAATHENLGDCELAEKEFLEALETSRKRMRPNHPELLTTIMSFALFYQKQGRFDQAEPLLEEWLDGLTEAYGPHDASVVLAKNSLAIAYEQQGKRDQALPLYVDCYDFHQSNSGPCAYRTANVLFPLTECEYRLGNRQANADRLEQFCLSCEEEGVGNSWECFKAKNRLGRAYLELNLLSEAESVLLTTFDQLVDYAGDVAGPYRSAELIFATGCLKELYGKLEQFEDQEFWETRNRQLAIEAKQNLIDDYSDNLGIDHPETLAAKRQLVDLFLKQNDDAAAYPILIELFELSREQEGLAANSTVELMFRLAVAEHALKKSAASATRLQAYLDLVAEQPNRTWSHVKAKSYLGRAQIETGQFEAAERLLLETFEEIQAMRTTVKPSTWRSEVRKVTNRLMELYKRMGNEDQRAVWRTRYQQYKNPPLDQE